MKLVLSCEHGGNGIPAAYTDVFARAKQQLNSHRGWDPGALDLYRSLQPLSDAHFHSTTSRLLIELNRSLGHAGLYSKYTAALPSKEKAILVQKHYLPFRTKVRRCIAALLAEGHDVLHVSVHSFTPIMNGVVRKVDIGFLYDPQHGEERELATRWKQRSMREAPKLRIRANQPYLGTADGHTKALRRTCGPHYHGIELEVRNDMLRSRAGVQRIARILRPGLKDILKTGPQSGTMHEY